jgi:8-oxo-dGTP pyrophosphatase MutT (NUDIX family)
MKTDLVVAGYIIHKGRVLLVHHRKLDRWLPPGGHIEANETPDQALRREVREELGISIALLMQAPVPQQGNVRKNLALPFHVNVHPVGDHDHCCLFYLCKPINPEQISINNELKDARWFSRDELAEEHIPEDVRLIAQHAFTIVEQEGER